MRVFAFAVKLGIGNAERQSGLMNKIFQIFTDLKSIRVGTIINALAEPELSIVDYILVRVQEKIIQVLVFEESNIKIYWCVKADIDLRFASVNITFHTPINLDIGLFKHQLLIYYFSVSSVWLIMSEREGLTF